MCNHFQICTVMRSCDIIVALCFAYYLNEGVQYTVSTVYSVSRAQYFSKLSVCGSPWIDCSVPQKLICVNRLRRRVKSSSDTPQKGNGTLSSKFRRWRTTRPLHISSTDMSNWNVTRVCLVCNAASDLECFIWAYANEKGGASADWQCDLSSVDPAGELCHSPLPVNLYS